MVVVAAGICRVLLSLLCWLTHCHCCDMITGNVYFWLKNPSFPWMIFTNVFIIDESSVSCYNTLFTHWSNIFFAVVVPLFIVKFVHVSFSYMIKVFMVYFGSRGKFARKSVDIGPAIGIEKPTFQLRVFFYLFTSVSFIFWVNSARNQLTGCCCCCFCC